MPTEEIQNVINSMTRDEMREYLFDVLDRLNEITTRIEADEFYNAYGTLRKSWEWGELKEVITGI